MTFQRLTIHNNALYIGATNHILQIALPDFTLDEVAELGPFEDNPECVAPYMCEKANCPVFRCVDNVNRLLIPHRCVAFTRPASIHPHDMPEMVSNELVLLFRVLKLEIGKSPCMYHGN